MKDTCSRILTTLISILSVFVTMISTGFAADEPRKSISADQLGAEAEKGYRGDGLSVVPTANGATLRCDFQKLRGQASDGGLWLESTTPEVQDFPFRIIARSYGRESLRLLPVSGHIECHPSLARFVRPGVIEEYSVNVNGVRQDFLVNEKPGGSGSLRVELSVDGAKAKTASSGVTLVLEGSDRKLAYNRLKVTDANGRTLTARIEVVSERRLAVVVDDATAAYPVRVDPTFSDANWVSISGMSSGVSALAVSGSDLYVGGSFTTVGEVANTSYIAMWNGSVWSALGTGMNGSVTALAVSGTNLYAGGSFTIAGGTTVNRIAKWNGTVWSVLGTGMNGNVSVLAVNGTNVYAGGSFTTAGGISARRIAKWNGGNWSALGTGMGGVISPFVSALAVSGTDLYAGGYFTTAGGMSANHIAKWDGSAWTALGTGVSANLGNNPPVKALAVSGTDLYVGGAFSAAGGVASSWCIAKWDGNAWMALSNGLIRNKEYVYALAVDSFGNLFVGGDFIIVDGLTVNRIAKWNGNAWSALSTGMNAGVRLLVTDTSNHLFVGGEFTVAGTTVSPYIAQANLPVPAPGIAVTQDSALSDAVSNINFGTVNASSGSVVKTFTITNTGDANLSGLVVNKIGTNAADFVVSALSGTSIAVGSGTVTFTVTFSPMAGSSLRTAAIHIASNVTGSLNPFDIELTGTVNNAPIDVALSVMGVAENVAANTTVGTLSSSDPDLGDTCSYSLVSGSGDLDNTAFTITSTALSINSTPIFTTKSSYAIRLRATDPGGLFYEKAVSINIVDVMEFPDWASSFSLIEGDAEPSATPFNDGIENLLKYAFNMNATGSDVRVLMVGGNVGLPMIALDSSGPQPVLRVEFLRRRGSGLIYIPQRSNTLGDFVAMTGNPTVTVIDAEWERVSVEEPASPMTAPRVFVRVEVSLP